VSRDKQLAEESISRLFELAIKTIDENPKLAQRYVQLARAVGMRTKTRIPRKYRNLICKGCKNLIIPGLNSRIRLQSRREPHIVITCLKCGKIKRIPLKRTKKVLEAKNERVDR